MHRLSPSASFLLWLVLLWLGWTLVFCGSSGAVLNSATDAPADLTGRAYFAGFTLTTLGVGDLKPGSGVWRIATVLAAASGFVALTLFVTYAFSVISALNSRRALGAAVEHLGAAPEEVVLLLRGGGGQALTTRLLTLTGQLEQAAMQTDAYPVLEYTHVANPQRSFARAVVILGEVSLLLEYAVAREQDLPPAVWKPLRCAVNLMIGSKHGGKDARATGPPPPPALELLHRQGVPVAPDAKAAFGQPEVQDLRTRWHQLPRWHGRAFPVAQDVP